MLLYSKKNLVAVMHQNPMKLKKMTTDSQCMWSDYMLMKYFWMCIVWVFFIRFCIIICVWLWWGDKKSGTDILDVKLLILLSLNKWNGKQLVAIGKCFHKQRYTVITYYFSFIAFQESHNCKLYFKKSVFSGMYYFLFLFQESFSCISMVLFVIFTSNSHCRGVNK